MDEEIDKFKAYLRRFAERLRERGEPTAAKAVESILKYVTGRTRNRN